MVLTDASASKNMIAIISAKEIDHRFSQCNYGGCAICRMLAYYVPAFLLLLIGCQPAGLRDNLLEKMFLFSGTVQMEV